MMKLLEQYGLELRKHHVKPITGHRKLWELRVKRPSGAIRLFYFAHIGKRSVILRGFRKSQKTPRRELKIAEKRMVEMTTREEA